MSPHLRRPGVAAGIVLFALLAVLDILSPWIFPAPPGAPEFANTLSVIFGVVVLVALGVWAATSVRAAMWVAVVIRVIGGLFSILAFTDATITTGLMVANVLYLVATVVALVLVVPTLRARRATAPTALA